ncbi:D-2-hydroxyacid dehydrogenase [Nitratidesulfovibrio vulgaris]|uniref:D-isomer specific 2-hydroxyacid dehydrogenase family protein n=3 Tax=Nitratidesulfovibrio vulgaris TaxID=881 RepID=Q72C72_NITV2|nr:D-2-hydroxyacid dehydrogenase [Nitratidesulfovibrio vulgaris]AAS95890.1 D-isomer specific 2-hydroxyacid dehydrogenase family protein [Nitratidesulfovibrio vulgaris str. Hildenborough]ABM28679.1 D-isomer specific 2-hydroxyacid dehydrogenase, NAD-binding protein [Nitratidesulfovibrio vulgaris DP4]ADP87024.1 D-isomer specific 2-hydroxyacid dehydrogenase NAD-binding protein [Nitratidesulfovibrio vulgaris RCH1]GEB79147.1 glycerate dehydrogenase [Desulfovibrio desulfuricans]
MRIVALDGYTLNPGDISWAPIEELGELVVHPRTPSDKIIERAAGAHVVLTNKVPLDMSALQALPGLRFVSVLATGYDKVDVAAAGVLGIPVSNVPGYGTDSVAQHVFALLLELCRRTALHDHRIRAGAWTQSPDWCFWDSTQEELTGKTMGIVGFGNTGRRVGRIANALGMNVIAYAPRSRFDPDYRPFEHVGLDELFTSADVVSLHCPLTPETEGLVDARRLASMRPGSYLINTARGPLLDERAVAEALDSGRLAGAGLDVLSQEPPAADNPLLSAKNCLITPHLAWASRTARRTLMDSTAANIRSFIEGTPVNVVNAAHLRTKG